MTNFFEALFLLLGQLIWHLLEFVGDIGEFFYDHVPGFHYIVDIPLCISLYIFKFVLRLLVFADS
jgi:hypothetical protein